MTQPSSFKAVEEARRYGVIIPARDEEACIGSVIDELRSVLPPERFVIAVGLNGTTDRTGEIAETQGALVGKTDQAGYGYGCVAAIDALDVAGESVDACIFVAGDGANDPDDVLRLADVFENGGADFVIGLRRFEFGTWRREFGRALPNLILGTVSAALTGRFFHDLGPLRLIERNLFEQLSLREMTWGWTMEAQIVALRLGHEIATIPVKERPRIAGKQKVSGVSPWRSARIGWQILLAAMRSRFRRLEKSKASRNRMP